MIREVSYCIRCAQSPQIRELSINVATAAMFACNATVFNQRQHLGLQQLKALAATAHSLLGPNRRHKFIYDDATGESALVFSCFRLLESLELSSSVGQLTSETVLAHHKLHRSGAGCLLFLAGAWASAALESLHMGVPLPHIISALSEGMEVCLEAVSRHAVSIEEVIAHRADVSQRPVAGPSSSPSSRRSPQAAVSRGLNRRKLAHSRHLCSESVRVPGRAQPPAIPHLARVISHGCAEAMELVIEASRVQSGSAGPEANTGSFDVNRLVTCVVPGLPEDQATVLPGCVLLVSAEKAALAQRLTEQPLRVVIIDGDLCFKYRHLGFNQPSNVQHVQSDRLGSTGVSQESEWRETLLTVLLQLQVKVILLSGVAEVEVTQRCLGRHVLVVERMRPALLARFAESSGAVPVTYATQLTRHCVGAGVRLSVWREPGGSAGGTSTAVNINHSAALLATVVICSPSAGRLQALEDEVWGCAHRLQQALAERRLLPGAGATELLCLHLLQRHARTRPAADRPHRDTVLHLMADGWRDYVTTIMVNTGCCSSKLEAWTRINSLLTHRREGLEGLEELGVLEGLEGLEELQGLEGLEELQGLDGLSEGLVTETPEDSRSSSEQTRGDRETQTGSEYRARRRKVYDNVSVKLSAWRRALDLVFLVLQTDAEIITGLDPTAAQRHGQTTIL